MKYSEYYIRQAHNKGYQTGSGINVYRGGQTQNGHGLGGIFNTLKNSFSWLLPILKTHALPVLKQGAEFVGKELINTASNIVNDAIDGKNIKETLKERTKEGINSLSERVKKSFTGGKFKRKITKISTKNRKKRKRDIFDN